MRIYNGFNNFICFINVYYIHVFMSAVSWEGGGCDSSSDSVIIVVKHS